MAGEEIKGVQSGKPAPLAEAGKPAPLAGPEAPLKPQAAPLPLPESDRIVDGWVVEYFYNSPIARDTACWNLLQRAKEVLKERLRAK